jgi:hypothetical protein
LLALPGEISTGVPGCPVTLGVLAGWCGTVAVERLLLAVEKSAEAVLPAGIIEGGWEGPNAKPRCRTLVLMGWTLIAANPARGLGGSAGG